ncbi:hypothetical protein L5515_008112 [Caenorhabditis briggsae]|uniref:Uncharacterized protein n=1 Tax=Caenorhabditis briggsae TaxID=6238 RepID=A0AAE9F931_CAEBR|nr:hypothetical protein L3Y34_008262 [Caenorhabditis briggsae]UMM35540.1 hypothetical protein L5515_008112 [Caenorhabditis briggsae]
MSEKSRNLMLKNAPTTSNQQHHSNSVPLNVFRGTSLISQLEAQRYPTSFTACASDFDNVIVPTCPNITIPVQPEKSSDG